MLLPPNSYTFRSVPGFILATNDGCDFIRLPFTLLLFTECFHTVCYWFIWCVVHLHLPLFFRRRLRRFSWTMFVCFVQAHDYVVSCRDENSWRMVGALERMCVNRKTQRLHWKIIPERSTHTYMNSMCLLIRADCLIDKETNHMHKSLVLSASPMLAANANNGCVYVSKFNAWCPLNHTKHPKYTTTATWQNK